MPLQSVAAANLMLDRMWATKPGTTMQVGLLNGDPATGGTELDSADCPGYARYTVSTYSGFWQSASGGAKSSVQFTMAAPTAAWDDVAEWEGIWIDGALFDASPLLDPVEVTGAGTGPVLQITRRFSDGLD